MPILNKTRNRKATHSLSIPRYHYIKVKSLRLIRNLRVKQWFDHDLDQQKRYLSQHQ